MGSHIVVALQSVVSRNLPPRRPGVITVGSFHSGTKHNIISDAAKLQITVRSESAEDRKLLLDGIKRVAENTGRALGLAEDMLPEVIVYDNEGVPPTLNDLAMLERMRGIEWDAYSRSVDVLLSRLRGKLKDDPKNPRFLKTVWGAGYMFVGEEK